MCRRCSRRRCTPLAQPGARASIAMRRRSRSLIHWRRSLSMCADAVPIGEGVDPRRRRAMRSGSRSGPLPRHPRRARSCHRHRSASAVTSAHRRRFTTWRRRIPPIAQAARVSGVVILEALIGEDGSVRDAKVLRSVPLLDASALEAVRQWRFTPTLLNGVPVQVIMTRDRDVHAELNVRRSSRSNRSNRSTSRSDVLRTVAQRL